MAVCFPRDVDVQLLHGMIFSKLNLSLGGDSGEWDSSDFEMDSDGGYPFAGETYGVAGTAVPSRSMEGWYPGEYILCGAMRIHMFIYMCTAHMHTFIHPLSVFLSPSLCLE